MNIEGVEAEDARLKSRYRPPHPSRLLTQPVLSLCIHLSPTVDKPELKNKADVTQN